MHEPFLLGLVGGIPARGAAQACEKVDRLSAGEIRPEADITGNGGDAAVQRDGVAPGIAAEDGRLAGRGAGEPEQHADGGGLPRAVRTEEAVDLPGFDVEVESVERADLSVALDEPFGVNDGGHERDATPISRSYEYS